MKLRGRNNAETTLDFMNLSECSMVAAKVFLLAEQYKSILVLSAFDCLEIAHECLESNTTTPQDILHKLVAYCLQNGGIEDFNTLLDKQDGTNLSDRIEQYASVGSILAKLEQKQS